MECGYELGLPDFKALSATPCCFSDFLTSLTVMGELKDCCLFPDKFFFQGSYLECLAHRRFLCTAGCID